ncbi:FHA domain-containing protein [Candidatus Ichthyocystis hellenicum]|uniref:FHA domain-containing protein n=1 Tax=Candidatus Ichthyocystis hellenicum TaxID=1561003 RepID=UPI000B816482|nr:FHA domain-containing protein [Candidatus Ichthyocystis hellenicum]
MTMIILEKNGVAVRSILVNKECIRIGRRQGNDCILSDQSVSGYHAEIHYTKSGYYIKDLSSTNGTFVNDQLVSFTRIKPDDIIRLGSSVIRLEFPESLRNQQKIELPECYEPELPVSKLNPNISGEDWLNSLSLSLSPKADAENCGSDDAYQADDGGGEDGVLELGEGDEWIAGTDENWAILVVKSLTGVGTERRLSLNKPCVKIGAANRCVFSITYDSSGYWLECLKGPELPLLNGAVCRLREPYRLFDGDCLTVHSAIMLFSWGK